MAYEPYESDFSPSERAADAWHRMGMHDFSERYGRYSGGDPYGYEYSERSIEHRNPRYREGTGFTRQLTRPREETAYTRESARRAEIRSTRARSGYLEETAPAQGRPLRRDRRRRPRGAPWARRLHERRARRHGFDARGYHEHEYDEARGGRGWETAPHRREPRLGRELGYGPEYRFGQVAGRGREYGYVTEYGPGQGLRGREYGWHELGRYPHLGHERATRQRPGRRQGRGQRWYEPRDPW